jgi:hypothetical protein
MAHIKTAVCSLVASALLLSRSAPAQVSGSPYLAADVGGSFLLGTTAHATLLSSVPVTANVEFDPGYRVDLRLGYFVPEGAVIDFHGNEATFHFAVELDAGYLHNAVSSGFSGAGTSIDFNQIPLLVNAIFTIPLAERLDLSLGFGLGGSFTTLTASGPTTDVTSTDFGFAYQGLVSFTYHFNPRLSVNVFTKIMGSPGTSVPREFGGPGLEPLNMDGPLGLSAGLGVTLLF